jgi:D-2-hydroxyglutarate dehydrogenase
LANGEILSTIDRPLKKDNTGYDLKNLFIGAEGTLGYVTAVSILCAQKPKAINAVLIACNGNDFKAVLDVFRIAKKELHEIISAFEFMDKDSMICLKENLKMDNPFGTEIAIKCEFYCLIETHGSSNEHDRDKLTNFFEILMKNQLSRDAIIAENSAQVQSLWALRENVAQALNKDGYTYKYDISLPLEPMYDIVINLRNRFKHLGNSNFRRCIGYGHVGV